jgi:hypothetical protein
MRYLKIPHICSEKFEHALLHDARSSADVSIERKLISIVSFDRGVSSSNVDTGVLPPRHPRSAPAGIAPQRCAAAGPRATDAMDVRAMQAIAKSTGADKSLGWGAKSPNPCAPRHLVRRALRRGPGPRHLHPRQQRRPRRRDLGHRPERAGVPDRARPQPQPGPRRPPIPALTPLSLNFMCSNLVENTRDPGESPCLRRLHHQHGARR